jgi:hypothetical protein
MKVVSREQGYTKIGLGAENDFISKGTHVVAEVIEDLEKKLFLRVTSEDKTIRFKDEVMAYDLISSSPLEQLVA